MKRIGSISVLLLLLGFSLKAGERDGDIGAFREIYKKAETPERRLELCIKAMENKLISVPTPIADIERMFGVAKNDWGIGMKQTIRPGEFVIHFSDYQEKKLTPKTTSNLYTTPAWNGFYLFIRCNPDNDAVALYYISNSWVVLKGIER